MFKHFYNSTKVDNNNNNNNTNESSFNDKELQNVA